jgi:cytochrome P450
LKLSFPFYRFVTTPKWRALIKAEDFFYSNAIRLVDEAILRLRDAVEAEGGLHKDRFYFLSYLVSKKELSLKDVTIICLSLFSDGLSTTTPTVLFNLYALATNPHVQQKTYDEIKRIVGNSEEITQDHINKLPYLKAFVKETFRYV